MLVGALVAVRVGAAVVAGMVVTVDVLVTVAVGTLVDVEVPVAVANLGVNVSVADGVRVAVGVLVGVLVTASLLMKGRNNEIARPANNPILDRPPYTTCPRATPPAVMAAINTCRLVNFFPAMNAAPIGYIYRKRSGHRQSGHQ